MRKHIAWMVLGTALFSPLAAQQTKTQDAKPAPKQEAPPEPRVKVGDVAPDFKLLDQNRKEVHLADFRGKKNVVLAFFIFAFTGG
jgi:cytochrome oxidase Cu insertion factor (SCO1/SenC/PrrC family)